MTKTVPYSEECRAKRHDIGTGAVCVQCSLAAGLGPATEFKLVRHALTESKELVEIWHGGKLAGCLYPGDAGDPCFKLLTKHEFTAEMKSDMDGVRVLDVGISVQNSVQN